MLHRCRVAITRANLDQIRSPGPDIYDPGTGIPTSSCDDRETDSELVNDGGAVHRSTDAVDTEIWTSDLQGQHVTGDVIFDDGFHLADWSPAGWVNRVWGLGGEHLHLQSRIAKPDTSVL